MGSEGAAGSSRDTATAQSAQRGVVRAAPEEEAPAGASGTAEGDAPKRRRRRRQQVEEQVGGQQRMQLDREPHSDTARAPAGGTAGGAVVDGHSGGPTVVQRKGRVRQQRSEEEAAGTAACRTGQGSPPAQVRAWAVGYSCSQWAVHVLVDLRAWFRPKSLVQRGPGQSRWPCDAPVGDATFPGPQRHCTVHL